MAEETNVKEAVEEIRASNEESLQKVIEDWFSRTRTDGMKLGAKYISAAVFSAIQRHIVKKNGAKASLRDYQRCIDEIIKIVSVQLKQETTEQNDSEKDTTKENNTNSWSHSAWGVCPRICASQRRHTFRRGVESQRFAFVARPQPCHHHFAH